MSGKSQGKRRRELGGREKAEQKHNYRILVAGRTGNPAGLSIFCALSTEERRGRRRVGLGCKVACRDRPEPKKIGAFAAPMLATWGATGREWYWMRLWGWWVGAAMQRRAAGLLKGVCVLMS